MSTPNWKGGFLTPPPITKPAIRNPQNGAQTTIMIEPTHEYQQFYNANRREMDRQRLEYHVTEENNLEPPKAQSMSRSTTSDSLPSPSTACSHGGDDNTQFSPDNVNEVVKSKPPRGKRTGPLDMETRTKTAFKRKFKLTCTFHRTKKTSCNCHDFSKLEAAYMKSLADEGQKTKASRAQSVRPFGDLGTFGAGGAAPATIPRYQHFDLTDLPTGHDLPPQVHASLRPVLDFDIQSKASVNAIVTAPHEAPFYAGITAPAPTPVKEFAIGSSMPFYPNRWECQYEHTTEDTRSLASISSCSWTGPFEQLENHFTTLHHPFKLANQPQRSICSRCEATIPEWVDVDERVCLEPDKCPPKDWQKWLFGTQSCQSRTLPSRLTVSEASGSKSSWFNPLWNMTSPGSSNTEHSNVPYGSYTGKSGFYEHLGSEYESSEADDGGEHHEAYRVREEMQNHCRCWFDTTNTIHHNCIRSRYPLSRWKSRHRFVLCDPRSSLPSHLIPDQYLVLSLLAPLIVFHFLGKNILIHLRGVLATFSRSTCLEWYLALTIVGSLVTWIAVGGLGTTAYIDNGIHALASAA
ncbi:hypothetical protein F4680DRAFT_227078 [Xylaria scruposa]|nr:hypothetical protein F4680DRAFT_227078 [Xylaria scruposa]